MSCKTRKNYWAWESWSVLGKFRIARNRTRTLSSKDVGRN